jgi:hypothetical protein
MTLRRFLLGLALAFLLGAAAGIAFSLAGVEEMPLPAAAGK